MSEFDSWKDNYMNVVEDSIAFIGKDVDFFAKIKADWLLQMTASLGPVERLKVLDVGAGIGLMDLHLKPIGELHGCDVSSGSLELASLLNEGVHYAVCEEDRLPYPDGCFDLTFAVCVMHHVQRSQWSAFLAEMKRVTKPEGRIVIMEHNPWNPLTRLAVSRCELDRNAELLSHRELRAVMKKAGLIPDRGDYIVFFPFEHRLFRKIERWLSWLPLGAQYAQSALMSRRKTVD